METKIILNTQAQYCFVFFFNLMDSINLCGLILWFCDSWGYPVQGQEPDFDDPCGALLAQDIPWFCDYV